MLNSMTLTPHEFNTMNPGSSHIGINNSLRCSITDGMEASLLTCTDTQINVFLERIRIKEFPTAGMRCIEIGLVQAGRMRAKGAVNEEVSPGATSTESAGDINTTELS